VFCDQLWVLAWDTYGRRPPTQHDLHRLVLGSSKASLPTHLKGLVLEHFPWARGIPCCAAASSESWHFVDTSPAAGAVFDASLRPAINDVPGLPRNNSFEQPRRPV